MFEIQMILVEKFLGIVYIQLMVRFLHQIR